jgi:S1-C subfamily serine protease
MQRLIPILHPVFSKSLIVFALVFALTSQAAEPERSVVQIITFSQEPDWDAPWRFSAVRRSSGSGFVIKGKRVMTNAHVVSWGKEIIIRKHQDPKPYQAKVEYVAHDCDLAVLTLEDEKFFDGLEPLEVGELPEVRSTVITYGYPAGGNEISYTRGVVSRIEISRHAHIGNRSLLGVQTDAAINPGNSGGPVIQENKVVGVAFQGISDLENTGFFIPPSIILRFLKDVMDKRYDGVPMAGIRLTPLQNPAYRSMLKLTDENVGARVDMLLPIPETQKLIKPDDVVLKIGDYPLASDGTILFQGNRVSGSLVSELAQSGDVIPYRIWRDGTNVEVNLPVHVYEKDRATGNQYDVLPRYYVYGGLVFTPLSLDYLRTLGRNWSDPVNRDLVFELYNRPYEEPENTRPEPIVLASVLADAVNANVKTRSRAIIDKINSLRIERLEDVIRAFETNTNAYDVIEFLPNHDFECLNRGDVEKANPKLLQTYGVTKDRRL